MRRGGGNNQFVSHVSRMKSPKEEGDSKCIWMSVISDL